MKIPKNKQKEPISHIESKKLWGGRFEEAQSGIMERIGESISFDKVLYKQDIRGSIAHAKMLNKIGVINAKELASIEKGMATIEKEIESGNFIFTESLEDIHMHIESRLTHIIGDAGKKLHTARSRNDQVSQDVRLYLKDNLDLINDSMLSLLRAFHSKAKASINILFPGYTHLQIAQPIRASHYLLAYFWAFSRDLQCFLQAKEEADVLVLGSGALAGVNYNTDRKFLQKELGLARISENSMDAVGQRDHLFQFMFAASQFMIHASRFCEELIIYSSTEFSYIRLPDRLTSGSSIMPQKKNPDVAELIRGKSGIVIGNLMSLLSLVKGTPLTYNRDFQEDKPPIFQTMKHLSLSIEGIREMVEGMEFRSDSIESSLNRGFATATDLADWLVSQKKVPFREAHEIVGRLVSECVKNQKDLFTIDLELRKNISDHLTDPNYFEAISLSKSADKKDVPGGTALRRQKEQLTQAEKKLVELNNRVKKIRNKEIRKNG
ncbi:argininosuccinate lyase [Leptospira sp. GIMC2001]|uniref:argininosuccinate lyase n=1 Tax=Leptospira sp. GIMC2001 TaxID=1513297 RepID=UPI00234B2002|nr:argininosuccinate lyase [Leptospira sp. GIMC2001]WCL47869.1 argininosuccinate lyase [Leptospira sp. GIMC2001]